MNNLPTVSDTKRAFYNIHTRPVNSIYRRIVEELMVEMHLLRVNEDFQEDGIFALGMVTTYDRFMEGYTPAEDRGSIFEALCRAQEKDAGHYRHHSDRMLQVAKSLSKDDLINWLTNAAQNGGDDLQREIHAIATHPRFKYSRLFGVGLATMLETADPEALKDMEKLKETLQSLGESLHLPVSKLQRDVELYCSNLEKMVQTRQAMADMVAAERKRREKAEAAAAEPAKADNADAPDPSESTSENISS